MALTPRSSTPTISMPKPGIELPATPGRSREPMDSPSVLWRKLLPVLLYRMADAAAYSVIFPFISDMITSFDVPLSKIGLYAGLGEGALMISESLFSPLFALASDRYGRRMTTLFGFLPVVIFPTLVGFSWKPWHVVLWRVGINPITITGKSLVFELSTPQNRTRMFALYSPAFMSGFMLGVFLGGQLAHPYGRLPSWLGGTTEIWREWPYALPCVVMSLLGVFVTLCGIWRLPETRPPQKGYLKVDEEDPDYHRGDEENPTFAAAWKTPGFAVITFVFCFFQLGWSTLFSLLHLCIANFSFDAIYSVYTYTAVPKGGLGLPVDKIGILMSLYSLSFIIVTPLAFPRLASMFGDTKTLYLSLSAWPVIALSFPIASHFANSSRIVMWLIIFLQQLSKLFGCFAWPLCDMIFLGTFDAKPELRATGAAISTMAGGVGRAIGPVASGWLYSISTQYPVGTLGRQLYWIVFLAVALSPILIAKRWLGERKTDGYEALPLSPTTPLHRTD